MNAPILRHSKLFNDLQFFLQNQLSAMKTFKVINTNWEEIEHTLLGLLKSKGLTPKPG